MIYFSIKAFNGTKRRFENLDNTNELNQFIADYTEKGFTKFIIRSFDSDGFRKRKFFRYNGNILTEIKL